MTSRDHRSHGTSWRVASNGDAAAAAWSLSLIGIAAGVLTMVSTLLPRPAGFLTGQVRAVSFAVIAIALVIQVVPWRRLPVRSTLALTPLAFALIAWHNWAGGTDPFRYGIFFVTVFLWLGVFHPRGTSLWVAPMAAVAYLTPLLVTGQPAHVVATVVYSLPLYVVVAELVAARSAALARTEARLRRLAEHDPLTGLHNREVFLRELAAASARRPAGVIFVDIDNFKSVNDRHGHAAGDAVLQRTAEAITSAVRSEDLVARLSGDEFAVLLRGDSAVDDAAARAAAQTVLDRLHTVPLPDGTTLSASVGVALGDAEALVARADGAMYAAKRAGKDLVALAS
jgi:diguanylate cyclase (GGDEF)-like protein